MLLVCAGACPPHHLLQLSSGCAHSSRQEVSRQLPRNSLSCCRPSEVSPPPIIGRFTVVGSAAKFLLVFRKIKAIK
eukprot:4542254-Pleurochrysis_carterae.AAC.1